MSCEFELIYISLLFFNEDSFDDLSMNLLTGEVPVDILQAQNLQNLILSKNSFSGKLRFGTSNLTTLKRLVLNNNMLSGSISQAITRSSLTDLTLYNNKITGTLPEGISALTNLTIFPWITTS